MGEREDEREDDRDGEGEGEAAGECAGAEVVPRREAPRRRICTVRVNNLHAVAGADAIETDVWLDGELFKYWFTFYRDAQQHTHIGIKRTGVRLVTAWCQIHTCTEWHKQVNQQWVMETMWCWFFSEGWGFFILL